MPALDWKALGKYAFRDYVTDGVPASGINEPSKQEIRDFIDALSTFVPVFDDDRDGTTDTLAAADNGLVIPYTSETAVTVTVPNDVARGWSVTLIQRGGDSLDGLVTVTAEAGATLASNADAPGNLHRTIDGVNGYMNLLCVDNPDGASAVVIISGDTRVA